jgi:hypothetical protein
MILLVDLPHHHRLDVEIAMNERNMGMRKTWCAIIGIFAICLVACSQTPSVTSVRGTPQPTATPYPTNETLQITEWHSVVFYTGTPIFTATITDGQKIVGAWNAITSLPTPHMMSCGGNVPGDVPYDSFDFHFFENMESIGEAKIVVAFTCAAWDVTSTQWSGQRFYLSGDPQQSPQFWQALHDLTGVPIPVVPTPSP